MPATLNEISKVFLHGETLESAELNEIILQVNSTINRLNTVESNLLNHGYGFNLPITNIYCRTKKGINAINFFPLVDAKKNELLELVSSCDITQGIKYDINFSTVTISEDKDLMNGVWTAYPLGISSSLPHEWEVSYKKLEDNSIIYMYGPVLCSNYGYNGTDGDSIQYIYKLFDHKLSEIEEEENTPIRPENPDSNGDYIPYGWKDAPQGPIREYPFEYVAILKKIRGNWDENFEKISLWSTFSESGNFLVRVFCRYTPTQNKLAPNTPIGGTYNNPLPGSSDNIQWSLSVPAEDDNNKGPVWTSTRIFKGTNEITEWSIPVIESDSAEVDIEYSSNVEKPLLATLRNIPNTAHPSNNIWHDPTENNIDLSTMVWRAERKIKNGQYDGNWVITKIIGQKGNFKSFVFRRFKPTLEQLIPSTPTGGTYNNPIPDGGLWSDEVPSGNSVNNGPIWVSSRIFTDDGAQSNWSTPRLLADSETLDIEFSPGVGKYHSLPNNPEGNPFTNREAFGWYDPSSPRFNSVGQMVWRAERKVNNGQYVGNWMVARILGEKGDSGVNLICDPSSLIVNLSLLNPNNLDDITTNNTFNVTIYKGTTPIIPTSINFDVEKVNDNYTSEFIADDFGNSSGSGTVIGGILTLKKILKDSNDNYYETSTVNCTATYVDGITNKTIAFTLRIYANLLGTWAEKVVGDAKTEVAKSLSYAYDPSGQNVVSLENMGKFIKSSTQDTTELRQKVYDDILNLTYPATSSGIDGMTVNVLAGTYKVAGEFNLVTLPTGNGYLTFVGPDVNKTWNLTGGLVDSIDDEVTFTSAGVLTISTGDDINSGSAYDILNLAIYQSQDKIAKLELTADGLTSDVNAIKAGKNMLSGVLTGTGWKSAKWVTRSYVFTDDDVKLDDNGWMQRADNYTYIASVGVYLEAEKTYTLSFDAEGTESIAIEVEQLNFSVIEDIGHSSSGATRRTFTFQTNASSGAPCYILIAASKIKNPQLELGEEATDFVSGDMEVSSRIKQTADEIDLSITNKLGETGININGDNRVIDLIASKVTFSYYDNGTKKSDKISINAETGALKAVDGDFEGKVTASAMYLKTHTGLIPSEAETAAATINPTNGAAIVIPQSYIGEKIFLPLASSCPFLTLTFYVYFNFNEISTVARICASGNDHIYTYTRFKNYKDKNNQYVGTTRYCKSFYPPNNVVIKIHSIDGKWCLECDEKMLLDEQYPVLTFYDDYGNNLEKD